MEPNLSVFHLLYCCVEVSCGKDGIGRSCTFGEICVPDATGKGRCKCDDNCPYVKDVVCGSNGQTYYNECQLKLASCQRKRIIKIKHRRKCGKGGNSYHVNLVAENFPINALTFI